MDSYALELRFLEEARRGRGAWRIRQRVGIYAMALGLVLLAWSLVRMFFATEDSLVFMRAIQAMCATVLLSIGWAMWYFSRILEGAAIHVDPPPPA